MPIYEYECPHCNKIIELWADIYDYGEDGPICKKCETKMSKIISLNSFHLKGSGWARDGYQKE